MGVIVLAEMKAMYAPTMKTEYVPKGDIVAVHAAEADPLSPEQPAHETLCGKSTAGMDKIGYQPSHPRAAWYPQNLEQWVCRRCSVALRSG